MTDGLFELRSVTLADIAVLAALHASGPDEPWSSDAFARLLVLPGVFGWLATTRPNTGAAPIGFALARRAADEVEILAISVLPASRRCGVGRSLLEAVIASAHDSRRVLLEVAEGNEAALSLYRRFGMSPVGRRAGYYARRGGSREDALILALSLDTLVWAPAGTRFAIDPPKS